MDPRLFTKQWQAQRATVAAVPPLADDYVLSAQETTDGHEIGAPDLLDMSPQGQLRDAVFGNPVIDGLNLIKSPRIKT